MADTIGRVTRATITRAEQQRGIGSWSEAIGEESALFLASCSWDGPPWDCAGKGSVLYAQRGVLIMHTDRGTSRQPMVPEDGMKLERILHNFRNNTKILEAQCSSLTRCTLDLPWTLSMLSYLDPDTQDCPITAHTWIYMEHDVGCAVPSPAVTTNQHRCFLACKKQVPLSWSPLTSTTTAAL